MTAYVVTSGTTEPNRQDLVSGDTLTVQANGNLNVAGSAQAVRFTSTADGVTITNNGTIQASGGQAEPRAIRIENSVTGPLNVNLTNTGTITSSNDVIQVAAGNINSGTFNINNSGLIAATGAGQAIDLSGVLGNALGVITNNPAGVIRAAAQDAIRFGGKGNVNNVGTINGGSDTTHAGSVDGINFLANSSGTITNDGSISADRHAINVSTGAVVSLVNNATGVITGRNGSGFGSDAGGSVTNYGIITGAYANIAGSDINSPLPGVNGPDGINDGDGDGVDIDGSATINNYGTIQGTGSGGHGSDRLQNKSEGVAAGGGQINNFTGGVISGADVGIAIDNGSQGNAFAAVVINNNAGATIRGLNGAAISIISTFDNQVTNYGTITSVGGTAIAFGVGYDSLYIGNTSSITGVVDGGGGAGINTIGYQAWTGGGVTVNLATGVASGTGGIVNFSRVEGSDGADTLTGATSADTLEGGGGADNIFGGDGVDVLRGDAGDDNLYGGLGANSLYGGDGGDMLIGDGVDDLLFGGASDDQLYGQNGQDTLDGGLGNDFLRGMNGEDIIYGGGGLDTLWGEGGSDVLLGGSLADTFLGGSEDDQVYAYAGGDNIDGGVGNDFLRGMDGSDTIRGGTGFDSIVGDGGSDQLYGDAGADRFVYLAVTDSVTGSEDRVFDFVSGEDKFDFSAVTSGQAVNWQQVAGPGGGTALEIDIGSNGSVDMRIVLAPGPVIVAGDLIFT